jgi:hypothetical protein
MTRCRGLAELLRDAVHHGTIAVERVHQHVARTPLEVIAHLPPLAAPARRFAALQGAWIGATYSTIRAVNGAVGVLAVAAAEWAERRRAASRSEEAAP